MQNFKAKLSVCVPVYNAERILRACLESLATQDFTDWELLVVNDGSTGTDADGNDCRKIVKDFRKAHKLSKKKVIYLEHRSNLGLVEARRTLVEAAHSEYIVCLDSDDSLLPGALKTLYGAALESDADIVQGGTEVFCSDKDEESLSYKRAAEMKIKSNNIFNGQLNGNEVFDGNLVQHNHNGFLWGKLIRRETYLNALSYIPFTRCVFAEDFLQYFFISYCAKKYVGIKTPVYRYNVDTGISSMKKITDLARWEQVCSTANVFSIIFSAIKEFPEGELPLEQMEALRLQSRSYLVNNIRQMRAQVIPELHSQARQLLCDYWGTDFVEMMEKAIDKPE